jgi:hypothetical protein
MNLKAAVYPRKARKTRNGTAPITQTLDKNLRQGIFHAFRAFCVFRGQKDVPG